MTLQAAQAQYRKLGEQLSSGSLDSSGRARVKAQRRQLEVLHGPLVRLTSATPYRSRPGEKFKQPTWSMRQHITVPKPRLNADLPFLVVQYDPQTGEPVQTFPDLTSAVAAAFRVLASEAQAKLYLSLVRLLGKVLRESPQLRDVHRQQVQ